MSQEIDQRVVEMRFDNTQFEKNSRDTMRTLDKLKEKLSFKGAAKGLEQVQAASENVDFSGMEKGLDTVQAKFSALDVVAFTALQRITDKVISTGEQMVKSLSVDQITSGWDKYNEKTSNVQTIMNATGKSIDQVNGYLNKLMWYSDETSYSFNEMTSALSQMTAAGGKIDKMIPMIMGIANATADAGKMGFAFQSTIRNLTQSYSAGHLQLQDWKSLNLMGTATKALKQELIDTAVELGVIKEGEVTIASFESSLQKKWANTKVMEKTFAKYASMMEAAYELTQKNPGMTSSEALEQLKGQYGELAERAALAAQQATSFGQAIDSTKDAVSSKWMAVFETIFGNKEEATDTWTELANRLYDIFVPPIEALNDRMKEGLDSGWQQMRDAFGDQADAYTTVLEKLALANGAVTEEAIEKEGSFAKALQKGKVNAELLTTSLSDTIKTYAELLETMDEGDPRYPYIQKDYEAFLKLNDAVADGSLDLEQYAEGLTEVSGREHLFNSLWNIMDAIGKVTGSVHEAFTEIFPPTSGEQIHSIAEGLDLMTKKLIITDESAANLKQTFKGIFAVVKVPLTAMTTLAKTGARTFGVLVDVLRPVGAVLLKVAGNMGSFVSEMQSTLLGSGTLSEKLEAIVKSAKKLLDPLTTLGDVLKKSIGEKLSEARKETSKWADSLPDGVREGVYTLLGILEGLGAGTLTVAGVVGGALSDLKKSANKAIGTVADFITGQSKNLNGYKDVLTSLPAIVGAAVSAFAEEFKGAAGNVESATSRVYEPVKAFFKALKDGFDSISGTDIYRFLSLLDVGLLSYAIAQFAKAMNSLRKMLATPLSKMLDSISGSFNALTGALKTWQKQENTKILTGIGSALLMLAGAMFIMSRINPERFVWVLSATVVLIAELVTAAKLLKPEVKAFDSAVSGLGTQLLKASTLWGSAAALLGLAAATKALCSGFVAIADTIKGENFLQNLAAFAAAVGGMYVLTRNMGMLIATVKARDLVVGGKTLLGIGAAIIEMGVAMLYLAGAGAIFGALALFADPLCTAIINAAPDIEAALVAVVTLICGAINQSAEPIGEAFTTLCKVLIQTAIDLIGWAWSGEGGEGEGIKGALLELKDQVWNGIKDIFAPFGNNGNFQQRNVAFKFNPDFKPQRINVADVFTFSGAKDDAEKEGKEIGENVANGGAKGVEENKARATGAVQGMVDDTIDAAKKGYDINSPSRVFEEIGRYITEGLAIGIQDPGALSGALAAMQTVAKSIRSVFTTFWGIHSPSQLAEEDGRNVVEGLRLGIGDPDLRSQLYDASYDSASQVRDAVGAALDEAKKTASDKMLELYSIMKADHLMPDGTLPSGKAGLGANRYQQAVQDYEKANAKEDARNTPYLGADWKPSTMWDKATEALQKYQSGEIKAKDALKGLTGEAKDWVSKQIGSALGLEGLDPSEYADLILEQYSGYLPDDSTGASTASSGKKSSSKGKTLAETIAEKYTKELKSNKYLQNAADKEYSLWEAGEGDTASIEALIEKKGETLAKSIELQAARVDIAQRQYDELVSRVGASDDKTKEAYNTLLDEKKNLLDLQQARFENTYKAATERYESDDKLAQTEYQLWADTYEKTASVTEKSNKNIETINKRLAIQSEKTALAEKAWVETKDALGEASLVTQQAYRDYLEARQEQLELENELDKAQLAAFDDLSSFYDSRISMAQKRMTLLDKLYNDGDLSGREDAYASAVEQYGEDSIEARRAATQGTMTALMGVNSALTSMRWQMSKVTAMQQKYQTALEQAGGNRYDETVMAAYEDMMETRSTFADYVGNLADAFNVSDATKKAMMQFGDAIAQNWKPIQNGFMAVAKKMNPKLVQGFSDLFGLYMKDGASETVAAATNTVVAAMSGDWASAVASGLTAVLDVVGTDFGQTLTEAISTALKNAFSGNGLFAQLLTKLFGSINLGGSGSSGGFLSNLWQWLKGGASAAKSFLGGASTAAVGASGATKLIPVLNSVGTATANVASGVTTVAKAAGVAKAAATTAGAATSGVLAKVGMGVAKVASGLGPHGLLAAAVIAGTVAVGTAVVKNWDKVKEAVGNAWSWIKEKASGLWDGMKSIGGNLMSGLATGVKSAAKFGLKVALSPAYAIISGFKHILGIHSPSKVMAGIGEYVVEGLTRGIVSTEGEAEKGMDEVGGAVIRSALATTNAIADHLSTDNHPSITPVVDLSDASRSSAWLNSAFADRKGTISMAATVTGRMARRAETPSRNQNGYETAPALTQSNRDVVEAVKTLGERIDRVAESVKGMKVVMNGRKFVGEIRSDIDDVVGDIIEKGH